MNQIISLLFLLLIAFTTNINPLVGQTGEEEIAYITSAGIRVMHDDGRGDRLLISNRNAFNALALGSPVWSSNGDRIAFTALISTTRSLVCTARYDGSNIQIVGITDVNGTSFSSTLVGQISWSADDRYISFVTISLDFSAISIPTVNIIDLHDNNKLVGSIDGYAAAQFEPVSGSVKIAMSGINFGTAQDFVGINDLSVNNGAEIWWTLDRPNDFKNVAWLNSSTIYAVVNGNELVFYQRNFSDLVINVNTNERLSVPSISKDGTKMVFSVTRANNSNEIVTADIDSRGYVSNPIRIGFGSTPSWRRQITIPVKKVVVNSKELELFPNPAHHFCTVKLELPQRTTNISIKVVNILGQTVLIQEMDDTNSFSKQLDVSGLQAGKYTVMVETEEQIYSSHFMKIEY